MFEKEFSKTEGKERFLVKYSIFVFWVCAFYTETIELFNLYHLYLKTNFNFWKR